MSREYYNFYGTNILTVHLDETKSDRCMSELIGSHRPGGVPCDISSQCVFLMTSPGLVGYGITHQLLWTMLAEKVIYLLFKVKSLNRSCCFYFRGMADKLCLDSVKILLTYRLHLVKRTTACDSM